MFLYPISDIHGLMYDMTDKFLKGLIEKPVAEHNDLVVVIAGDFCDRLLGITLAQRMLNMFPNIHIVYVPGNHEYYGTSIEVLSHDLMKSSQYIERLHVLDGMYINTAKIDDVTFIGGTLWTDFNKQNTAVMNVAQREMNDYNYIYHGGHGTISTNRTVNEHYEQRKAIFKALKKTEGKRVVITHHKPFLDVIRDPLSYAYCVDLSKNLDGLEKEQLPTYWFYGHTHRSDVTTQKYKNGEVTFISNQYGYPSELSTGWSELCVWEI